MESRSEHSNVWAHPKEAHMAVSDPVARIRRPLALSFVAPMPMEFPAAQPVAITSAPAIVDERFVGGTSARPQLTRRMAVLQPDRPRVSFSAEFPVHEVQVAHRSPCGWDAAHDGRTRVGRGILVDNHDRDVLNAWPVCTNQRDASLKLIDILLADHQKEDSSPPSRR